MYWKFILWLCILSFSIVGCSSNISQSDYYRDKLPPELSDCKVYTNDSITIVRCPNSTTTTKVSKNTTIVIDGMEYIPKK